MRVISGKAKGMQLASLEGKETRPTLDRVKEALFSKIQFDLEEAVVLDLFSGSGAIGIEALSRGASKVVFCDYSNRAIEIIEQNLKKTKLTENAIVLKKDYLQCLENTNIKFNIIFIDPPYKSDYAKVAIDKILELDLLENDGYIVVETDDEQKVLENLKMNLYDMKKYGRVKLMYLARKG